MSAGGHRYNVAPNTNDTGLTSTTELPIGSILLWGSTTLPTNYLLCNGAAVSRLTYASLYQFIGTFFGAGDGSTTFNIPSANTGAAIIGIFSNLLGASGGADTVTLLPSNIPDHYHTIPEYVNSTDVRQIVSPIGSQIVNANNVNPGQQNTGVAVYSSASGLSPNPPNAFSVKNAFAQLYLIIKFQ